MRLDKYLSNLCVGSRSQVKEYIKDKKVKVNGNIVKDSGFQINENKDEVTYMDKKVDYSEFYYYMLNKPQGVVSATTDFKDKTVLDLINIPQKKGLFPVGRLDKDTEGLLLITNNGELAHKLLSPTKHVEKTYYVELKGGLIGDDINTFLNGVDIGEKKLTKPAKLEIIESGNNSRAKITITEGKYHQVKRMFLAIGLKVIFLKRISMGTLQLDDDLKPGEYRELTKNEIESLKGNI